MEEKSLSASRKWTYALGNNGFFIAMTLYTAYPLVFMTACLHLPFPQAITILTLIKIIDIVLGFFSGAIIEKCRLPWGKYRSWFLVGPVVAGISCVLFYSPLLLNVPGPWVVPLGVFLQTLWMVSSNLVQASHNSLNAVLVKNPVERISVMKLSNQLQGITGFVAGFFMMKIVFAIGKENSVNLPGMQAIGIIYSILYFALYFIFFLNLRTYRDEESGWGHVSKIGDTFKVLFTNGKAASLTLAGALYYSAENLIRVAASYYFLYALLSPKILDAFNWTIVAAAFAGASLALPLARKTGKKGASMIGGCFMAVFFSAAFFTSSLPWISLLCICAGFFGLNFTRAVMVPMYSDVADYAWHSGGVNVTSHTMTLFVMIFKFAGLVAAQASGLLAKAGYIPGVEAAPETARGIGMVTLLLPAAFAAAGTIVQLVFYRLDEKRIPEIQAEIRARIARQSQSAAQAAGTR